MKSSSISQCRNSDSTWCDSTQELFHGNRNCTTKAPPLNHASTLRVEMNHIFCFSVFKTKDGSINMFLCLQSLVKINTLQGWEKSCGNYCHQRNAIEREDSCF